MACFRGQRSPATPAPNSRSRPPISYPKNPQFFTREEGLIKLPVSGKTQLGQGAERVSTRADVFNSGEDYVFSKERAVQAAMKGLPNAGQANAGQANSQENPIYGQSSQFSRPQSSDNYNPQVIFPTMDSFYNSVNVLGLNRCNMKKFLPGQQTAFVLFYDPADSKCCLTKRNYTQAACEDDETIYTAVNCSKEGSLCQAEQINGYPTVKFYKRGRYVNTFGVKELMDNSLPRLAHPTQAARQR